MISQIKAGLGRLRGAGLKAILRFQYNDGPYPIPDPDASKATILNHLIQLKPVFQENADVIAVLQAGFIGAWGEWHTSTNGLETKLAQKEILLGILQALPPTLMTQIRVPEFKGNIFESDLPIQESQAFNQSVQSRVGHHNIVFSLVPTISEPIHRMQRKSGKIMLPQTDDSLQLVEKPV